MSNEKKANKEGRIMLQTPELLLKRERDIIDAWMKNQLANVTLRPDLMNKEDLEKSNCLKKKNLNFDLRFTLEGWLG